MYLPQLSKWYLIINKSLFGQLCWKHNYQSSTCRRHHNVTDRKKIWQLQLQSNYFCSTIDSVSHTFKDHGKEDPRLDRNSTTSKFYNDSKNATKTVFSKKSIKHNPDEYYEIITFKQWNNFDKALAGLRVLTLGIFLCMRWYEYHKGSK